MVLSGSVAKCAFHFFSKPTSVSAIGLFTETSRKADRLLVFRRNVHFSALCFGVPRWRAAVTTLRGEDRVVDAEEARNFVVLLEPHERDLIMKELSAFKENPGDDTPPTPAQLKRLMIYSGLPFLGFGFLDNFLMIIAGSYIELGIGMVFTISTMAAAALGNTVSDIAGVGSAGYVEHLARKLGSGPPPLTAKQLDMRSTRWRMSLGRTIGITIGCFLGMLPLLFYTEKVPSVVVKANEVTVLTKA